VDLAHPASGNLCAGGEPALYCGAIVLRRLRGLALHLEPELCSDALLSSPQSALIEERGPLRAERRQALGREARGRLQVDDKTQRGTGSAHRPVIIRRARARPGRGESGRGH
jgi:hypothetical protein